MSPAGLILWIGLAIWTSIVCAFGWAMHAMIHKEMKDED